MLTASFGGARAALDLGRSLCWLALSVTVEDVPCSVACRMASVRRERSSVVASGVAVALAPDGYRYRRNSNGPLSCVHPFRANAVDYEPRPVSGCCFTWSTRPPGLAHDY